MDFDIKHANLLDMRKSEGKRLAAKLSAGVQSDFESLWETIENTLSRFLLVLPENEEQIYFFGVAMRDLVASLQDRSIHLRDHANQEVKMVFAGGFLGWSFDTTLDALMTDRRKRGQQQASQNKMGGTLVKDIEAVVASIVPTDRPVE